MSLSQLTGDVVIMGILPELQPVVEAPWYQGRPPWPWPIADHAPFSLIRLSGDMMDTDVGSVFGRLVKYNDIEGHDLDILQAGMIEAEALILSSGLLVTSAGCAIGPSCCCGLEKLAGLGRFSERRPVALAGP